MSSQGILEKAIQKAKNNGWKGYSDPIIVPIIFVEKPDWSSNAVLMDSDFAKALWGEQMTVPANTFQYGVSLLIQSDWQMHLQQMVIADDPIEYLGANI